MFKANELVSIKDRKGAVGTVVSIISQSIYTVRCSEQCCSWIEIFFEDEIELYTSKGVFFQTPNGLNHLYRAWKESEEEEEVCPIQ